MNDHTLAYPLADLALARRLERAEALSNARFVEARAALDPSCGAEWIEVAGAYAMFDGVSSPLTQSFGLGVFGPVSSGHLDRLEAFFTARGAPTHHEVSPLSGLDLLARLHRHGYHPVELTSVLYRPICSGMPVVGTVGDDVHARLATEGEHRLSAELSVRGWSEHPELADFLLEIGYISSRWEGAFTFLALLAGRPVATAVASLCDGVALLAGASTVPEARRRGAQLALLDARLRFAAERGCDLAMVCAEPGSASQRNAERHGFRIAYTRIKWHRPLPGA